MKFLTPETKYEARVRAICSDDDMSSWSYIESFATTAVPDCPTPYNLTVSNIESNSALLSWEADDFNTEWMLRWRATSSTEWTEVEGLVEKQYTLTNISENCAYVWRVRGYCDEKVLESALSEQNRFETTSGVIALRNSNMKGQGRNGMLSVLNGSNSNIEFIEVVALDGKLIGRYDVNSSDNVVINTGIRSSHVIVRVVADGKVRNYRVKF